MYYDSKTLKLVMTHMQEFKLQRMAFDRKNNRRINLFGASCHVHQRRGLMIYQMEFRRTFDLELFYEM